MKKTILIASLFAGISGKSQTLTQATHANALGNAYSIYQCDSLGVVPGASGASANWDFMLLNPRVSSQKNITSTAAANASYAMANVFVNDNVSSAGYFKSTITDSKFYGGDFVMSVSGNNSVINTIYSSPAIIGKYPMSLNTAGSLTVAGTLTTSVGNGSFTGTSSITADATGTLMLASKTFTDVVRVITTQTLNVTGLNPVFGNVSIVIEDYNYYSVSVGNKPVLTISNIDATTGFGSNNRKIVTLLKDYELVSVKESKKDAIVLSVFPNPCSAFVNFSTKSTEAYKITIYDITSKLVGSEFFIDGKSRLNVSDFTNGIYMYSVVGKNNEILTTGKFNVTK